MPGTSGEASLSSWGEIKRMRKQCVPGTLPFFARAGDEATDTHDGGSQQGKGETASQPGHDTAIGLVPFGEEEGSESFVGGGRSCAQTTSERGVNEACSTSLTHCSYRCRLTDSGWEC